MGSGLVILDNAPVIVGGYQGEETSDVAGKYLREQADLTAVEKFSQLHEDVFQPIQEQYYRDLLPLSKPKAGEQYAFEVDLDLCTGCKGCVTACKSLNGLGDDESWRDVGMVHDRRGEGAVQHVTTACHHCLEPACASGCPVNAYVKLEDTGVVKHLDDQCIGCQYCTLTCPYDVPKFSKTLGIVRKCDMCVDRLEEGEAPACVQACPTEAIKITIVGHDQVLGQAEFGMVVPGTPPSDITFPTTRFKTKRAEVRELLPADYEHPQIQHGHLPLIVMLVLTQVSVGVFLTDWFTKSVLNGVSTTGYLGSMVGLGVCTLALAASILHLGRPLYAFRAIVGLRHSWLSREILAFGLFVKSAALLSFLKWLNTADTNLPNALLWVRNQFSPVVDSLEVATIGLGLLGVFSSVMVYHVTRRIFWNAVRTFPKFLLTMLVGGSACLTLTGLTYAAWTPDVSIVPEWTICLVTITSGSMMCKLALESLVFLNLRDKVNSSLKRTAILHLEHMKSLCLIRLACGVFGGLVVPLALANAISDQIMSYGALAFLAAFGFVLVLAGELLERYLFFTAVVALKMPGGIPG